jgi:hypothetical protein
MAAMRPEDTIDFPIRKVWSRISRLYNTEAAKYGGTMAVGQILLSIDPGGHAQHQARSQNGHGKPQPGAHAAKHGGRRPHQARRRQGRQARGAHHLTTKGKQMRDVSRDTVVQFNQAVQSRFTQAQLNNSGR